MDKINFRLAKRPHLTGPPQFELPSSNLDQNATHRRQQVQLNNVGYVEFCELTQQQSPVSPPPTPQFNNVGYVEIIEQQQMIGPAPPPVRAPPSLQNTLAVRRNSHQFNNVGYVEMISSESIGAPMGPALYMPPLPRITSAAFQNAPAFQNVGYVEITHKSPAKTLPKGLIEKYELRKRLADAVEKTLMTNGRQLYGSTYKCVCHMINDIRDFRDAWKNQQNGGGNVLK